MKMAIMQELQGRSQEELMEIAAEAVMALNMLEHEMMAMQGGGGGAPQEPPR